jgi:aquaporin TIP
MRYEAPTLMQQLLSEFLGVFALCFIGILAITHGGPVGAGDLVGVALAHGLAIAVMVAAFGAISGAHFNPAVTVALLISGRIPATQALLYIVFQLIGGLAAAWLLMVLFGAQCVAAGTPALGGSVSPLTAIALEAVATFFLAYVVLGTAVDGRAPRGIFPFAIGLTVCLDILAIGPLTGAAMNPARVFGPALIGHVEGGQLVYWVGPLLGALIAALVWAALRPREIPEERF